MLRSSLYDYSDAYLLVSGTITVPDTWKAANTNSRKNRMLHLPAP